MKNYQNYLTHRYFQSFDSLGGLYILIEVTSVIFNNTHITILYKELFSFSPLKFKLTCLK